ncbi:MAG: hypothetical protein K2W96_04035 [Gemmataceae bacterium]|nr:hypothetical protein [Gemmataceae bacterium]
MALVSDSLRDSALVQPDRQQFAAVAAFRHYLDNRLELRQEPEQAAGHVLAWKGQVLSRQQRRRLFLRLSEDPEVKEAARRLEAATRALASLRFSPTAALARLSELQKEQEAAQAALASYPEEHGRTGLGHVHAGKGDFGLWRAFVWLGEPGPLTPPRTA